MHVGTPVNSFLLSTVLLCSVWWTMDPEVRQIHIVGVTDLDNPDGEGEDESLEHERRSCHRLTRSDSHS